MEKKIVKRDGTVAVFDRSILERSLMRTGASKESARSVAEEVEQNMHDGDTTSLVYKQAFDLLSHQSKHAAMRYSLKRALFNFGPTGFPFEKFVGELFRRKGYIVSTNVHLQGRCVSHEVDVFASKPDGTERTAMEIKFHNDMHTRSDVKSVLYVKARFDDLLGVSQSRFSRKKRGAVDSCLFVTNTKFTKNALQYATCAGVSILGWGYPYNNNLQTWVQEVDAHPITCLPSISSSVARQLFDQGVVTCQGLLENPEIFRSLPNADTIADEAALLCRPSGRR
ncbi:MAG: restriction endonuclease [Candidatus Kaiserbacteria bacterium]|nr:restriction endonuclease [Candidatus Kaiserbacteria bacterium]